MPHPLGETGITLATRVRGRAPGINLGHANMGDQTERGIRDKYAWLWFYVGLAVTFVGWTWFAGVWRPQWILLSKTETLDARGNVLAALFSGLAFVGVVAAIFLQWKELGYQREELRQTKEAMQKSAATQEDQTMELREQTQLLRTQVAEQIADSRQGHLARMRQSREQFLTARLNASLALLHAEQAKSELPGNFDAWVAHRSLRILELEIRILRCEAQLGFEPEPWKPDVERQAIRQYLEDSLQDVQNRLNSMTEDQRFGSRFEHITSVLNDFQLLGAILRARHHDIFGTIQQIVGSAPKPEPANSLELRDVPAELTRWASEHLAGRLHRSNAPWCYPGGNREG
jgi:hypothetical protein